MLGLITLLAALFLCGPAVAKPGNNQVMDIAATVDGAAFTTIAMNTSRTLDAIEVDGLDTLQINHDFVHNSGTAVTMTCSGGNTQTGTFRPIQVLTYSGATAASDTHTWSQTVAGNEAWPWVLTINGHRWLRCTWTVTAGAASDTLTVTLLGIEH